MTVQDLANKCRDLGQECFECPYKKQCDSNLLDFFSALEDARADSLSFNENCALISLWLRSRRISIVPRCSMSRCSRMLAFSGFWRSRSFWEQTYKSLCASWLGSFNGNWKYEKVSFNVFIKKIFFSISCAELFNCWESDPESVVCIRFWNCRIWEWILE